MVKDFSKFKRLFVFGCSYTAYKWPSWAYVLKSEIDDCEFYNFGITGAGNQLIALRVAEANKRYKFTDTDLVGVMWTSFTREDRWVHNKWLTIGNIYHQNEYPYSWVKKYCDPNFYLIRDYALMELTKNYLDNLPCSSVMMTSWPINLVENNNICNSFSPKILNKTTEIYSDALSSLPLDLRSWQEKQYNLNKHDPAFHLYGHVYRHDGTVIKDGHPNTQVYHEYLKFVGLPLTDKSKSYTDVSMEKLKKCEDDKDFGKHFADEISHILLPPDINRIF